MSVYAIGDVQGCLFSLENLLKLINYKKSDQLIFLGDVVNRGNNSHETLRFLKALNADVVLGNHDLHTIGVYYGVRKISKSDTIANLTKSLDADSLIHWLKSKPLFLKKYDHVFVHAGMNPLWSLNQCLNYSEKISYALIKNPETTLKKIAEAKSNLRYIHLFAHIKTTEVLSKSQIKKYNQLRGYADNPCEKIPEGHNKEMWMLHNGCD